MSYTRRKKNGSVPKNVAENGGFNNTKIGWKIKRSVKLPRSAHWYLLRSQISRFGQTSITPFSETLSPIGLGQVCYWPKDNFGLNTIIVARCHPYSIKTIKHTRKIQMMDLVIFENSFFFLKNHYFQRYVRIAQSNLLKRSYLKTLHQYSKNLFFLPRHRIE